MKNGRWPTRPVCSDVTSLSHGLGKWVNLMLTPLQQKQPSYFKDSFELKKLLDGMELPPNALLFTSDATSMYTNIKTDPALDEITQYLRDTHPPSNRNIQALIEALPIVFRNNLFKFGDIHCKQISGTAMGTPPAPPWATVTYGLHESNKIIPKWTLRLFFYKRFIDDIFGIWLVDPHPATHAAEWEEFKADLNGWNGMNWDTEKLSTSVNFMDLTISIKDGRLVTTLYEKSQNLYLYIPPHLSHPRGVLNGLIFGQVLRIRRLCTYESDADAKIRQFFDRLIARGHSRDRLIPLFTRAEANAAEYISRSDADRELLAKKKLVSANEQVLLHLEYHPDDPPARDIQRLWQENVASPANELPVELMRNAGKQRVGFNRLVIAYSRPQNLGNQFSVRDIHGRGRDISSYLAK